MQIHLAALRTIPGDPCAPTEPCIPTDPCINERLLSALPRSLSDTFYAQPSATPMHTWGPGDPCAPTDPCIDAQPGDPCAFALLIASLGDGHDLVALNPQPLPPGVSSTIDEPSPEPQFAGIAAASEFDPGVDPVALNPQPLPPQESNLRDSASGVLWSRFDAVALEPQPLPWNEGRFLFNLMSNIGT